MKSLWECKYCHKQYEEYKEASECERKCKEERYSSGKLLNEKHTLMFEGYKKCLEVLERRFEQLQDLDNNSGGTIWDSWWEVYQELDCFVPVKVIKFLQKEICSGLLDVAKDDLTDTVMDEWLEEQEKEKP